MPGSTTLKAGPAPPLVRVARCRFGLGVFAVTPFRLGERILSITGPLTDIRTLDGPARHALMDRGEPVQVGPSTYVEPEPPGRYVNHSCEPNAGLTDALVLIAIRVIAAGEEIVLDYSTTRAENDWTMDCRCGTPSCRGIIGGFQYLPPAVQRRYLAAGVVQAFIAAPAAP